MENVKEVNAILDEVRNIDKQIDATRDERKTLLADAIQFAPFKMGDRLTVNTYAYKGKTFVVDRIVLNPTYYRHGVPEWKATGFVLKKDGKPGANRGEYKVEVVRLP